MFSFDNNLMLGLWGRDGVVPAVTSAPGGSEFAFVVLDDQTVDTTHANWVKHGIPVAQTRRDWISAIRSLHRTRTAIVCE